MDEVKAILDNVSLDEIRTHIINLEGVRHPVVSPDALEKAADYIWEHLNSFGYEMMTHYFMEGEHKYRNIIGTLVGSHQPEKKVIVLAHYDTVPVSPGANDNASGVAAVLELARVLKGLRFQKSILFIGVNLEERMSHEDKNSPFLRGSKALAQHAVEESWDIDAVLDFEEIAYAGETVAQSKPDNLPLPLRPVGDFIAVVGNENSENLVKGFLQSIERYNIPLPYAPIIAPGNGELFPDIRRSDHAAFWDVGYRAIMITDTANFRTPYYHQPGDVIDTLNLAFATEVCRAAGGLVIDMAGYEGH